MIALAISVAEAITIALAVTTITAIVLAIATALVEAIVVDQAVALALALSLLTSSRSCFITWSMCMTAMPWHMSMLMSGSFNVLWL